MDGVIPFLFANAQRQNYAESRQTPQNDQKTRRVFCLAAQAPSPERGRDWLRAQPACAGPFPRMQARIQTKPRTARIYGRPGRGSVVRSARNATQESSRDLGAMDQISDLIHSSRGATRKPEGFSASRRRLRQSRRGSDWLRAPPADAGSVSHCAAAVRWPRRPAT